MKRQLVVVALVAGGVFAVGELGDLTQSRPDRVQADTRTELVLAVEADGFGPGEAAAADALWSLCQAQIDSRPDASGLQGIGAGRYRVVVEPAVGHRDERKLVGCLEDLTIDRVLGDVELLRSFGGVAESAT